MGSGCGRAGAAQQGSRNGDPPRALAASRRAKLEAEGWSVPPSVSTVPIPGVNMPLNADYRTWQPSA